jgi:hypothetical protein
VKLASIEKKQVSKIIMQCFNVLNVYGKKEEALSDIVQMFILALEDHDINEIEKAFIEWIKTSSVMPTPFDILKIIGQNYAISPEQKDKNRAWLIKMGFITSNSR